MARICLVSHNAAGAFRGGTRGHIGGVERQAVLLARFLKKAGHEVSVITWADNESSDWEDPFGIRMIGTCPADAGIRVLRFVAPRWTSLVRALNRANADVYFHNAAEVETGQIGLWCRQRNRKFVYSVASEPACTADLASLNGYTEKIFYRFGLRSANLIITQTRNQARLLSKHFGLDSLVLPMPCEAPDLTTVAVAPSGPPNEFRVLWVGRIVPLKRLEWLLAAAQALPDIHFDVIASANSEDSYSETLVARAHTMPNVSFVGRVPYDQVWSYYMSASALVCTSMYEGFPNTFLEAMATKTAIVSTFDPDQVISTHQMGRHVESEAQLTSVLKELSQHRDQGETFGQNGFDYFCSRHRAQVALPRFEKALIGCIEGEAGRAGGDSPA